MEKKSLKVVNMNKFDQSLLKTDKVSELRDILDAYGVAILEDYFSDDYADEIFYGTKKWLINLNLGLTKDPKSWTIKSIPLGPRYGMYQSIVSHSPEFWRLREDMYKLFVIVLEEKKLLCSIDGASIYPPYHPRKIKDWPHLDQTISSEFMCYQSQFVSTNTTASFVATIGSHLKHEKILDICGATGDKSNWHKFTDEEVIKLQKMFGKNYQTPIYAKKGSVIFWDSRTIHSAKYHDPNDNSQWRGAFYVSMRPKNDYTKRGVNTLVKAVREGRTTNHWGIKTFPTGDRYHVKNDQVLELLKNLESLSFVKEMTDAQKKLCGLLDY